MCESVLFASILFLVVYAWPRFVPGNFSLSLGLSISDTTAAIAAATSIISTILCFWLPKKHTSAVSIIVYFMAVSLIGTLIFTSGGIDSPFISSWLTVALFAGLFGGIVSAIMVLLAIAQIFISSQAGVFDLPIVAGHLIFGLAPIALGFVLWHRQPKSKKADNSFSDLANKLSTAEGKSDVVISSIDDGVISIDRGGIIDLINPAAEKLIGWKKGDALGLDWKSVLKLANSEGKELPEIENPVAKSLLDNSPIHDDTLQIITSSDRKRLVSIVSSPVGRGDGIIVVFRDITKEKAEEREQAEFISTASHEMRTPVASIEGYLGLALNPATAQIDDKARDFITKAHQSAKHLGELFQNLLDISQAEDGRLKSSPEVIDVSAMVGDIFEGLSPIAAAKNLRYIYKPSPSSGGSDNPNRQLRPVFYSHVDPSHLREVVSNLIENAIKYTLVGDVQVDVDGDDKIVTISIQDSGIGIPTEDIPHLFQKFYRVDNTDTREINGTGLGLYLCRRLAESMDGTIRVESTYKQGSTFFLDIPRMSHEDAMEKINMAAEEHPEIIPINPNREMVNLPDMEADQSLSTGPPQPQLDNTPPPPAMSPSTTAPIPGPINVTQTSGSDLEFKIPSQYEDLPLQDMTLADIEAAIMQQPTFEQSGQKPLNILPEAPPSNATTPITPNTSAAPTNPISSTTPATPNTSAIPTAPQSQQPLSPVQQPHQAPHSPLETPRISKTLPKL